MIKFNFMAYFILSQKGRRSRTSARGHGQRNIQIFTFSSSGIPVQNPCPSWASLQRAARSWRWRPCHSSLALLSQPPPAFRPGLQGPSQQNLNATISSAALATSFPQVQPRRGLAFVVQRASVAGLISKDQSSLQKVCVCSMQFSLRFQ